MFIEFGSGGFPGTTMIGTSGFPGIGGSPGGDIPLPDLLPTCILYLDLFPWIAGYKATLSMAGLPMEIDGREIANVPQEKQVDADTGRILFDAVPRGCEVAIICEPAGINATYLVPNADSFAIAGAVPLS